MALYKVSYVVPGQTAAGTILNQREEPRVGETVVLRGKRYRVVEVIELIPPQGVVHFLHVTLAALDEEAA